LWKLDQEGSFKCLSQGQFSRLNRCPWHDHSGPGSFQTAATAHNPAP
jgi:hypothetical protein